MIRQTLALLYDSYRDLNSRRMFWIVLILSGLVAGSFGVIGFTPTGFELFFWKIHSAYFNSTYVVPADFYNGLFIVEGIHIWLTFIASILALISTASMFPDFLATGAIDLYLSKPIGRFRLFLTRYLFGLLFVALQIACFLLASFLVIGLRGGVWEPGIFYGIPLVVLFFSYLYCVAVLIGIWTRSTIAAILLTCLFWLCLFGLHTAEVLLLKAQIADQTTAERLDSQIATSKKSLAHFQKLAATRPTTRNSDAVKSWQTRLDQQQTERADVTHKFDNWHQLVYDTETFFPKTAETVDLLQRKLINSAHLQQLAQSQPNDSQDSSDSQVDFNGNPVDNAKLAVELNRRSVSWIVGTSVGFEVVVLIIAAWVFCRRDY
jgi:ABC-type transport system involved in multi-copper enzyme maturation permease subunit